MSYYRQQLEDWLKELDVKTDVVFDIGGKQLPVKGRTKTWEVKDYEILDLPRWNLNKEWTSKPKKKADIIFCLEVFEYLLEPLQALKNIKDCLKPGGKAYITFAFVYPHHNELELDSLRYTERGAVSLGVMAGFKGYSVSYRRDKSGQLQSFYATDGMHPAKEYHDHSVTGFIIEFTK